MSELKLPLVSALSDSSDLSELLGDTVSALFLVSESYPLSSHLVLVAISRLDGLHISVQYVF